MSRMSRRRRRYRRERPDGANHSRITLALLIPSGVVGFLLYQSGLFTEWAVPLCVLGCFLQLFIGPDLDQDGFSYNETLLYRIPLIGWIIGTFWYFYWLPYAKIHRHRGSSHVAIIGTLGRVAYMVLWTPIFTVLLLGLSYLTIYTIGGSIELSPRVTLTAYLEFLQEHILTFVPIVVGLAIGDFGHILRDSTGLTI